mmetsp:Transcript_47424/g.71799  ORF Transcript_47424/g.71799 Transcript_47424/m.71799 type:complete len:208 (-) Transcript_47424:305-928(-)
MHTQFSFTSCNKYSQILCNKHSMYEDLEEIVKLASQPLPERPDGIVAVAKFTSATRKDCKITEGAYERLARDNTATIFLRCFEEYPNADMLIGQADVSVLPTFDVFYGGHRVARVEGPNYPELESIISQYQFANSKLDLFSEEANNERKIAWSEGKAVDMSKAPKTTNRFIPGYDWDTDKGFFDAQGDKAQESFEDTFGNWLPNVED